ncbi:MAG TPA: formyltransferase family protein, partial [Candidatus Limiplasma sp.]|nr:formyltransferase family protein [Candidatus Limiplasma sp.]
MTQSVRKHSRLTRPTMGDWLIWLNMLFIWLIVMYPILRIIAGSLSNADLLLRNEFDRINAEILAVVSNHELLQSLTERFGIPYHFVPHEDLSREAHEKKLLQVIDSYKPEYLVLAKYMRILTPAFVER